MHMNTYTMTRMLKPLFLLVDHRTVSQHALAFESCGTPPFSSVHGRIGSLMHEGRLKLAGEFVVISQLFP